MEKNEKMILTEFFRHKGIDLIIRNGGLKWKDE